MYNKHTVPNTYRYIVITPPVYALRVNYYKIDICIIHKTTRWLNVCDTVQFTIHSDGYMYVTQLHVQLHSYVYYVGNQCNRSKLYSCMQPSYNHCVLNTGTQLDLASCCLHACRHVELLTSTSGIFQISTELLVFFSMAGTELLNLTTFFITLQIFSYIVSCRMKRKESSSQIHYNNAIHYCSILY